MEEVETIIETWDIWDLEEHKWELMIAGKNWEAYVVQYQIDQLLMSSNVNFVWDEKEQDV